MRFKFLRHLLSPGLTYPNMFDAPSTVSKIDGNFGGAAGIAEMLMAKSRLGTVATAQNPT